MIEQGDGELVEQTLQGRREAFGRLVERYQKPVFNVALRMLHDEADAEDAAQTTFIRAYQKLGTFDPAQKFFSWLYRIVVNESLNMLKRRGRFERFEGGTGDKVADGGDQEREAGVEQEAREQRIQEGLMELKAEQRAVIVLKHFEGLSYAEIGEVLEIPEKKVKSRLFAARTVLRNVLIRKGIGPHG